MDNEMPQVIHSNDEEEDCELCKALKLEIGALKNNLCSAIKSLKEDLKEQFPGNDQFIEESVDYGIENEL